MTNLEALNILYHATVVTDAREKRERDKAYEQLFDELKKGVTMIDNEMIRGMLETCREIDGDLGSVISSAMIELDSSGDCSIEVDHVIDKVSELLKELSEIQSIYRFKAEWAGERWI